MSSDVHTWPLVKLSDLITIKHGFAFKGEFFSDKPTEFQLITPANFAIGGGFQLGKGKYYAGEFSAEYVLKQGDLIVTMTDLSKAADTLGYAAIVPEAPGITWLHNQRVGLVQVKPDAPVVKEFLHYLMRTEEYRHWVVSTATGSTVKHTSPNRICEYEFRLPPEWTQREIGRVLTAQDDRIALLRETNATLEAMAQVLFKSWFVDFDPVHANAGTRAATLPAELQALFPHTFTDTPQGPVPEGWRVGTLSELAEFQNGYAFKSKDWTDSGHPVVKIGDVKPGVIDFSGCSYVAPETVSGLERFRLNRGDLLVGMTGYVGETGLVPSVEPVGYLNQRVGRFSTQNGLHDCALVYCLVRNPEFKAYAETQSHGSAQANVSGSVLQAFPAVIPDAQVIDVFNLSVYPMLESILSNYERAQSLELLRDTLLPRLISGNLRVADCEVGQ